MRGSDRALTAFALSRLPGARPVSVSAALRRSDRRFSLEEPTLHDVGVAPGSVNGSLHAVLDDARRVVDAFLPAGGVLVSIGDEAYPSQLLERLGDEAPPVLVCVGDLSLLKRPKVALLNSRRQSPVREDDPWVEATLLLAEAAAEAGIVQVGSRDRTQYDLPRLKAELDNAPRIVVLEDVCSPDVAPKTKSPLLVISPFLPGEEPPARATRLPLRDRLLINLADLAVAVEVRRDGVVHGLCRRRLESFGGVAAVRHHGHEAAWAGTRDLIRSGASQIVAERDSRALALLLAETRGEPLPQPPVDRDADGDRRQALGQYFTPRAVADLAWDALAHFWRAEHQHELPKHARVIDPSAGEGVFLEAALEHGIHADGLVGLDIDETLIQTWRQQFAAHPEATPVLLDGLTDLPLLGVREAQFDVVVGNPPFAGRGLRDLEELLDEPAARDQLAMFGSPPVAAPRLASRRQRARLIEQARSITQRFTTWRLDVGASQEGDDDDEAPAVDSSPPAAQTSLWAEPAPQRAAVSAAVNGFHAASLRFHSAAGLSREEREAVRRLAAFPIEVLFAERFVQLLKPGGLGAVVLPDALFAKAKTRSFRRWFLTQARPLAIIGLPRQVFTGVGAKVTTVLLVFQKKDRPSTLPPAHDAHDEVLLVAPGDPFPPTGLADYLKTVRSALRDAACSQSQP